MWSRTASRSFGSVSSTLTERRLTGCQHMAERAAFHLPVGSWIMKLFDGDTKSPVDDPFSLARRAAPSLGSHAELHSSAHGRPEPVDREGASSVRMGRLERVVQGRGLGL